MTITEEEREIIMRAANTLDKMSMHAEDKTTKQRISKLSTMLKKMVWIGFADKEKAID